MFYFENGVQGIAISPACFNINMESFLKSNYERLTKSYNFQYLACADELAFIIEMENLDKLKIFNETSVGYGLKINRNKSGIMQYKSKEVLDVINVDIPFVKSYNYIGFSIDNYGSINLYLGKIKLRS